MIRIRSIEAAARYNQYVIILQQFECERLIVELAVKSLIEANERPKAPPMKK